MSTGSTMHVILSDSEESSGWSRLLRFFVACRLLRMTVYGESLNLGSNKLDDFQRSLLQLDGSRGCVIIRKVPDAGEFCNRIDLGEEGIGK